VVYVSFPDQNIEGIKTFSPKEIQQAKYARLPCLLACLLARSLQKKRVVKTLLIVIDIKPSESSLLQKFVNSRQSRKGKKGPC
jgi:hypothetical protein